MSGENQKTILLVEDEVITAKTEKMTLQKYGYKIITANTGEKAVETVEKTPAIDLILMDINLGGGIDGTEAAEIILRQHDIPIVFLSSHTEPEIVEKTEKITSYGYVVKNSSNTVLQASIKIAFKLFEAKIKEKEKESQREAALEALRKSELKYRSLIECSSDAIFCVDEKGQYQFTNHLFASIFGKSPDYFIGKTFWDIYPKEDADQRYEVTKRVFQNGKSESVEVEVPLPGKTLYFYATANPIKDETGKIILTLTHATDITERKRAEEEIKRQLTEKEILLKEVHHRIRNNIASIGGLISLHVKSVTNSEAIAVLQDAIGRVNSIRILYDKLLFTEGYKDISVKNYLDDLIDTIIAIFPNHAKIILEKHIADFHLDAKLLFPFGIIINELFTNIMKYAFINRDTGLIKISLTNVAKHVTLTIHDNGNGLPAGFDINESKGLGLMLVKMLNQQLGGSFSIENHAGTRCIFEFNI